MAQLSALLDELQTSLESLLSCLESEAQPEPGILDSAWSHVQRAFEHVRAVMVGNAEIELDSARERLDHCRRLYAVAAGVAVRRREELQVERAACSSARQQLRRLRPAGDSGASCDVRA